MPKINYIGKCLLIENAGKGILVIGDLHLGYGESLRESGIMIPDRGYEEIVSELDGVFEFIDKNYDGKIDEVVLLGDLKHEFGRIMRSEWKEVSDFLDYLNGKLNVDWKENVKMNGKMVGSGKMNDGKIVIVKGNHDVITNIVSEKKGVEVVDYYISDEFAFVHGDRKLEGSKIYDSGVKYWVMGHGHPAVRISDGVKEEKYKCFLVGDYKIKKEEIGEKGIMGKREIIIVPSFFSVNEGTDARDFDMGMAWDFNFGEFNVKVVSEEGLKVLDFGKLCKLK